MKLGWRKILGWVGFKSYVKIPGKGFDDLTSQDVSLMIEAYLNGENEFFEDNALAEFVLMNYGNRELQEINDKLRRIDELYKDENQGWGWETAKGRLELEKLARELSEQKEN